jgi:hypothetical protein
MVNLMVPYGGRRSTAVAAAGYLRERIAAELFESSV